MKCGKNDHFKAVCKSRGKPKKTDITEVTKDDAIDVETITTKDAGTFTITRDGEHLTTLPVRPSRSHHDDWTGAGLRAGWGAGGEYCPIPTPAMSSEPQTLDTTPTPSSPSTVRETSGPPSPVRRSSRVRRPNQLYGPDMFDLSRD